jgi:flagellar motor switch protein FliN/FliY
MPETQQDIDALLAEVNALAEEAVATIAGADTPPAPSAAATTASPRPTPGKTATEVPAWSPDRPISPLLRSGRIPTGGNSALCEDISRILNIEVPIIVQLSERTMALSEILNLNTGSIIEFDKPADSELELKVNNKCIGSGQAVKVGENFGLRVVRVGTVRERIQAMGG